MATIYGKECFDNTRHVLLLDSGIVINKAGPARAINFLIHVEIHDVQSLDD